MTYLRPRFTAGPWSLSPAQYRCPSAAVQRLALHSKLVENCKRGSTVGVWTQTVVMEQVWSEGSQRDRLPLSLKCDQLKGEKS